MQQHASQSERDRERGKNPVASVAFPNIVTGIYDYLIPTRLEGKVSPGTPVLVSLRRREIWGVTVGIKADSPYPDLKEVIDFQGGRWTDSGSTLMKLYEWVAEYYQCDLGRVFRPLMRKGLLNSTAKTVRVFTPCHDAPVAALNEKYRAIWSQLQGVGFFSAAEAKERFGISRPVIDRLCEAKCLVRESRTVVREAFEPCMKGSSEKVILTGEQRTAVETIMIVHAAPEGAFLLHGITGSGKTHVYIELASRMLQLGKGVIILVPEIALTPQTIQRFRGALGEVVTVIHSHMSDGERRDSLQELVTGRKRVVIGVRSAVMAPMDQVGLIIVDEEHDGSYKQSDCEPRYNARDVAVMRGRLQKSLVVLGSATPSFESYHNAATGKYRLLRLSQRFGAAALPRVDIVDMREERRNNNWKPLSNRLAVAIASTIEEGRQTILLINRRGFSTVLLCKECGYTAYCPHCSVTLRYHRADTALKCHVCGHLQQAPDCCPGCGGENIKYKGTGIQKIEEFLHETLPAARLLRMDQDTTRRKGAHATILRKFADQEADILLGTQMVAKGLDFPGVALVGVIAADIGLHLPDFRASERTFQLLTQVAGRAGRCDSLGKVIIQTYCPDDYAIRCAAQHDYSTYFEQESRNRRPLGYPPWGRLARLIVVGKIEKEVLTLITIIAQEIRAGAGSSLSMLGPSPAVLERVANETRYTILLKSSHPRKLGMVLRELRLKHRKLPASISLIIDVDPVNML
ncbi:MAG: primosomal protein N' [Chitinispirillaceae bacterium]|nr:primosomal protein N' [Chitinispirillaceae bacterium]